MGIPTIKQKAQLKRIEKRGWANSDAYHLFFDGLLEEKLNELDPKWMESMQKIYDKSGMGRWYE